MTWLEFKRRINEVTSRLNSEEVPIEFRHGVTEICPTDITLGCGITGDKLTLIIVLKEGGDR
jgi:hypothetical protein